MGLRAGEGRELVVLSTASSSSCAKWAGPKPCFGTGIAPEFMSVRIRLPRPSQLADDPCPGQEAS